MNTITETDVFTYYKENNVTDFPKKKNGMPNMKFKCNMDVARHILKSRILEKNKKENIHNYEPSNKNEKHYRTEILNLEDKDIEFMKKISEECSICCEPFNGHFSILSCEHIFCTQCIIQHFRRYNSCPLCRKKICNKPKSIQKMNDYLYSGIINFEINNIQDYAIFNDDNDHELHTFERMLSEELDDFESIILKMNNEHSEQDILQQYKTEMKTFIKFNIEKLCENISHKISEFYESQL